MKRSELAWILAVSVTVSVVIGVTRNRIEGSGATNDGSPVVQQWPETLRLTETGCALIGGLPEGKIKSHTLSRPTQEAGRGEGDMDNSVDLPTQPREWPQFRECDASGED